DFFQTEKVDVAFLNEASPLLLYQVIKNGKPMAYKNYTSLVEFQLRCLKKYWETRKFRKMKEYLLKNYVERIR
ncbi:MAG: nucleotidyltransferase domain-containing protein, partial [Candidatus Kuenenia sp.]|nr:nucleotidyltransferase domain-containing protein [Candidatus Kuenenia sp.]